MDFGSSFRRYYAVVLRYCKHRHPSDRGGVKHPHLMLATVVDDFDRVFSAAKCRRTTKAVK